MIHILVLWNGSGLNAFRPTWIPFSTPTCSVGAFAPTSTAARPPRPKAPPSANAGRYALATAPPFRLYLQAGLTQADSGGPGACSRIIMEPASLRLCARVLDDKGCGWGRATPGRGRRTALGTEGEAGKPATRESSNGGAVVSFLSTSASCTAIPPALASPWSGSDFANRSLRFSRRIQIRLTPESLICIPRVVLAYATQIDRTASPAAPTTDPSFPSVSSACSVLVWSPRALHAPLTSGAPICCAFLLQTVGPCKGYSDAHSSHRPTCSVHTLLHRCPSTPISTARASEYGQVDLSLPSRASSLLAPPAPRPPIPIPSRRCLALALTLGLVYVLEVGVVLRMGMGRSVEASGYGCAGLRCAPPAAVVHRVPSASLPACVFAVVWGACPTVVLAPH
ncbi:hypothetical protein DFH06DRAFT_1326731 [Mycena polygramma]|nr:hypothetical protein DFH06DRAFT_1326731 [Mycena polygramma]